MNILNHSLGLKGNGDMFQMHCSSNNRVVILDSERNGLWEDLHLKPTKINST